MRAEPDFEVIAVTYLKSRDLLLEVVDEDAISTKLRRPWQVGDVALRVRRIGGLPTETRTGHLARGRLQIECFAGDEPTAFAGASIAVAELLELSGTVEDVDDVVVTAVLQDLGLTNSPDPDSDAERFLAGVVLYGHRTDG